jgi:hypothetical protein|tara:strand:- start:14412 stop:15020 length:609 start_codon:yes stop_codon:yes gene_type:complete
MYKIQQIKATLDSKGYKWFTSSKGYDVNIVGIRNSQTENRITNRFDDKITLSYKDLNGKWKFHCFDCTTDPGIYWAENLLNPNGVAILKPGQYRGSHKVGLHQGKYEALRQKKPLKVYRDGNKDKEYDLLEENVKEGIYGINIHRATAREHGKSTQIDKWSAGCQVIAANDDFKLFMEVCKKAAGIWGNSFTYTLIESKDII